MKILIIGGGYIGNRCHDSWSDSVLETGMIYSKDDVIAMIDKHNPDVILNAAGVRGKPNVDWCETNQMDTILGNTKLPIIMAEAAAEKNVYLLHIGSGCVFYGDSHHNDQKWREDDHANPLAVYSRAKYAADLVLSTLPNVGIARIRMPIDWVPSPFNMIDKLTTYPKVIDVENSATIIDDMIDVFYQLMEKKGEGIFHVTNPGTVRHREIVDLYNEIMEENVNPEWITPEELVAKGLAAKTRSNNFLHSDKLEKIGIKMRDMKSAIRDTMVKYKKAKEEKKQSNEPLSC